MATGDLKGNMRRFQSKLKIVGYPKDIDVKGFSKGLAQEYLPFLHYILLDYSRPLAQLIVNNDMQLFGKNDNKFVIAVYKVLRDIFHYKPSITRHQFFSRGFAEHKIMLMVDIIRMVTEKHKELCKAVPSGYRGSPVRTFQTQSSAEVFGSQSSATSEAPNTPDFITTSSSEIPVFLPTLVVHGSKISERDTGYHTAETSPTAAKSPEEEEAERRASVSVNELCAKFERKVILKQDSTDSKLSDLDLEEHPVIQALVSQIMHLGDRLTEEAEKRAKQAEVFETLVRKCENMSGHIVILQHKINFVENKIGATPISVVEPLQSSSFHSTISEPMDDAIEQDSLNSAAASPSPRSPPLVHLMPTYEPAQLNISQERSMEARPVDVVGLDEGLAADDVDEGLVDDDEDLGEYIVETSRDCSTEDAAEVTEGASGGRVDLGEIIFEDLEDLPVRDVEAAEVAPSRPSVDPNVYSQIQRVQNLLASTQQMLQGNVAKAPSDNEKSETKQ